MVKDLVFLPVYLLKTLYLDLSDFLSRWRTFAAEYEQKVRESQEMLADSPAKQVDASGLQGRLAYFCKSFCSIHLP